MRGAQAVPDAVGSGSRRHRAARSSGRGPQHEAGPPAYRPHIRRSRGGTWMTLAPVYSGKVRDLYDAGDDRLLFVTSDRISAFDVVMAEPIPDKGRVLTAITAFWLERLATIAPNHL